VRSLEANHKLLTDLYGLAFPLSLLQFHEFINDRDESARDRLLNDLAISPTGPLQLLALPDERLRTFKPKHDLLLHWRFYRDPPEFFTCLHGDTDGLHWGLLLDVPEAGFRGAASYYNNDGDLIAVYPSLFAAVLERIDDRIAGNEELLVGDPDQSEHPAYRVAIDRLKKLRLEVGDFIARQGIALDDGRPEGIDCDTGLDVIVSPGHQPGAVDVADLDGANALMLAQQDNPYHALCLGRYLWTGGGEAESDQAYRLLKVAYEALDRRLLSRVLELHYQHRNLSDVDFTRA
jgi:hypothetical protein